MTLPSYTKITKDGVEYISNADRCCYTIKELTCAALRDVGKFLVKLARAKLPRKTGRARRYLQCWVKRKQKTPSLQIGYKPMGFYGGFYETGTSKIPKLAVAGNIDEIRRIEGQYLSAIEDENRALGLINDEEDYGGDEN